MPDALSGCLSENCWKPKDKQVSLTVQKHANRSQEGCEGLPEAARWLGCAASLCTAEPPGWELAVGDLDSGPEDWTTFSCTGRPATTKGNASAVKSPLTDTSRQLRYLVGVHGQEGFVELDGLKLLLHQFVFDTFSICKFNFFLWVKHILVLWKEEFHHDLWPALCLTDLISAGLTEWLLLFLTNTHLVYCDDVVCSYSQQSHIWRPTVDRHELNLNLATFAKTYIKLMNPTLTWA